jgi:transcriptional regulator with XRE-family HTH domain
MNVKRKAWKPMTLENQGYNCVYSLPQGIQDKRMSKIKNEELSNFGARLKKLRLERGFTQQELANEINVSQRVIVYYERETNHPPSDLLPSIARALDVTVDELLGLTAAKKKKASPSSLSPRLERRLQQIESLNSKNKRQLLQIIDTFIEREKLQKAAKGK